MLGYTGIAFFDIDGVLANCNQRIGYAMKGDYDSFYAPANIEKDLPIRAGINFLNMFKATGYKIIIVTSRRGYCRKSTMKQLCEFGVDINPEDLYMREAGDTRKSYDVKVDLVEKAIQDNLDIYMKTGPSYFVDDYPDNCEAIEKKYMSIQTIVFGLGRFNDNGGEQ